ncbi:MAG: rhomboid family intramembrane serine protease, partial [Acidobacteria bacterium]|nr:rhomboid family intramembrane serine protease [Acidobacteriota bacterium]
MPLPPRLKWKINRYSQKMDERLDRLRNFSKSVMNKQKMCPACRALVDRKEKACPFCGERFTRAAPGGVGRLASALLPQQAPYTAIILSVNLMLFLATLVASMRQTGGMGAANLLGSIDSYTLVRFGAKYGPLIALGEWWRFLTPVFLHGNLLHFAFNTWVLFDLGPAVESLYGSQKFLVLYILAGVFGFVVSFFWNPLSVSIGASGALFGLIGAMIAYGYRNRRTVGDSVRNMYVRWAVYVLLFGLLVRGVDNAAHIGGLVSGLAFGWLVTDMPSITRESIYFWKVLGTLSALLVLFGFVMIGLR